MSKEEIEALRTNTVIKSNELIQKARYSLTISQQKILLFLISKIEKRDAKDTIYHTSLKEIADVCGISQYGGKDWDSICQDLIKLSQRFKEEGITIDGKKGSMSWLGDYARNPSTGDVEYWFNRNVADYLFELKEQYTKYKLQDILVFNCKYSIRLYEYIRSYAGQHRIEKNIEPDEITGQDIEFNTVMITISESEFRKRMDCEEQYTSWKELNRSVIKKAVEEINGNNIDIHIDYTTKKRKGQEKYIIFTVFSKLSGQTADQIHDLNLEWVRAHNNQHEKLGIGQHIGKT